LRNALHSRESILKRSKFNARSHLHLGSIYYHPMLLYFPSSLNHTFTLSITLFLRIFCQFKSSLEHNRTHHLFPRTAALQERQETSALFSKFPSLHRDQSFSVSRDILPHHMHTFETIEVSHGFHLQSTNSPRIFQSSLLSLFLNGKLCCMRLTYTRSPHVNINH